MASSITYKVMTELTVASKSTAFCAGRIYFKFEEVVEALRNSPYAYRFDFERYDDERQRFKGVCLYFKFKDMKSGSFYNYATYNNANLYLRRFELSYRKNRALPRIESSRYYCRYETIEQLMAMLAIVVPKIDELEKEILEKEQKDLRKKRIQELYSSTVPDLIKTSFAGSGLGYWYEMGRESIRLIIRLPNKLMATFLFPFKNLSEDLQYAIMSSKEIAKLIEQYGKVEIDKYKGDGLPWTEG